MAVVRLATLLTLSLLVNLATTAQSATVFVPPNTSLQAAIDAAAPGDVLKLSSGIFVEAIVIDKPLTLEGWSAIDPPCGETNAITITADGVSLRRLWIYGGTNATVELQDASGAKLQRLSLVSRSYLDDLCPNATYGLSVQGGSGNRVSRVETSRSGGADRYGQAFIRLRDIGPDSKVIIKNVESNYESPYGILIEDSADSPGGPPGLELGRNHIVSAGTCLALRGSDRISIKGGYFGGCGIGVDLDVDSNDNLLVGNELYLNGTHIRDDGSGNCFRRTKTGPFGSVFDSCPNP